MDICDNCAYTLLEEDCRQTAKNKELCKFSRNREINIEADIYARVTYKDILNVKRFVEMITKLEINNFIDLKTLICDKIKCPICKENIFLVVSEDIICISCYRKIYNRDSGTWNDLRDYDLISDMILRQTVKYLQERGFIEKIETPKKSQFGNFGEALLDMNKITLDSMNKLLDELNKEDLEFQDRYESLAFIKKTCKRRRFDLILDDDIKKEKESYNMHIVHKNNKILMGFINKTGLGWLEGFRYYHIETN